MPATTSSTPLLSPATASRRSQRTVTSPSALGSPSTTSTHHPEGERCSIRKCLRRLCRGAEGRLDNPTPLPPLDAEGTSLRCPSMRSLLGRGLGKSPKRSRAGSPDLDIEVTPEEVEEDMMEKEEEMGDPEPLISITYTSPEPISQDDTSETTQADATLPVSPTPRSPRPAFASIGVLVASQPGLSPGRVRRRDSDDDDEFFERLSAFMNSTSPRPQSHVASNPMNNVLSPSRTRAPLGEAPIPFRTSFLPQPANPPGTTNSRPANLPNLSRYAEETDTAPNELPIYRHYRQVRRRTALSALSAATDTSVQTDVPETSSALRGDVTRTEQQRVGQTGPAFGHAQGQASMGSTNHGEIESETNTDMQSMRIETERPDILMHSPASSTGSAGTGTVIDPSPTPPTRATTTTSTMPFPIYQTATTIPTTGGESPTYTPPTPPAMFMAVNGLGQYPAAAAGAGPIPPLPPNHTDTSVPVASASREPATSGWPHHQPPSWSTMAPPPGRSRPTRPFSYLNPLATNGANTAEEHANPFFAHAHQRPQHEHPQQQQQHQQQQQTPFTLPLPIGVRQQAPALFDWDTEWSGRLPPAPDRPRHQTVNGFNLDFDTRRTVFNPYEFYLAAQPPPPPPNTRPHLSPPVPPRHTAAMPSRSESLYSRLARLDSLRSENPVYRGEAPRPYLPVNEMTSTRRSVHHGRTASSVHAVDDYHHSLPPHIPPFGHNLDSSYRSTTSQWSSSSSTSGRGHSRWASRGSATASNAGSIRDRRPISRQDVNRSDTNVSWFNTSFPYEDVPYYGIGGTEPLQPPHAHVPAHANPPSPPAAVYGGSPTWNPEEAFPQSLIGEWGDLMGHVPIDTIGEGLHDPMLATARDDIHPFARTRTSDLDYSSISGDARSTSSMSPPPPPPPILYEFMEPVPPLVPSRPPFDPWRPANDHLAAFVASRSGSGGSAAVAASDTRIGTDNGMQSRDYLSPSSASRRTRDSSLNAFISSHGGGPNGEATVSGPSAIGDLGEGSGGGGLWMTDRQYTHQHTHTLTQTHAQNHRRHQAPALFTSNIPIPPPVPAVSSRVLSPNFLRHYRIDKNWPLEKQKHIVRVVVRLLNSFTPSHRKLEAQNVLRYVYWEDAGGVCETRGMEKETCCAICYEDYQPGQKLAITPCNHMYHKHCLNTWLDTPLTSSAASAPTSCPMCRRNLAALALITRIVWSRDMVDALPLWMDTMVNAVDTEVLNLPDQDQELN